MSQACGPTLLNTPAPDLHELADSSKFPGRRVWRDAWGVVEVAPRNLVESPCRHLALGNVRGKYARRIFGWPRAGASSCAPRVAAILAAVIGHWVSWCADDFLYIFVRGRGVHRRGKIRDGSLLCRAQPRRFTGVDLSWVMDSAEPAFLIKNPFLAGPPQRPDHFARPPQARLDSPCLSSPRPARCVAMGFYFQGEVVRALRQTLRASPR